MRIVKLSDLDPSFDTLDGVRAFFFHEIWKRTPPGRFRVTRGRIAQAGLKPGEPLVFTFRRRVVFTARAETELLPNDDEERQKYPSYFVVNLDTLREVDGDLRDVQRQYAKGTGEAIVLVGSRGWNTLPDSEVTSRIWAQLGGSPEVRTVFPDEVPPETAFLEGAVRQRLVNAHERNVEARTRCINHYGTDCTVCGFNFGRTYGPLGEGFIHVHHLRSLSEIGEEYEVDPITDMRPVCTNCHAMLHSRGGRPFELDEIRELLTQRGRNETK